MCAHALDAAAENLSAEAARIDHRADIGDRDVIDDAVDAGLDVDFDFGEAGDEAVGLAVAWIGVARRGDEAQAGERLRRPLLVIALMSAGSFVSVELAAALDGALGEPAPRSAIRPGPTTPLPPTRYAVGIAAELAAASSCSSFLPAVPAA